MVYDVFMERDNKGRFVTGNSGRPKGSSNRKQNMQAWLNSVNPGDVEAVYAQIIQQALDGDTQAQKLYLSYTVGSVPKQLQVDHGSTQLDMMKDLVADSQPKAIDVAEISYEVVE